MNKQEILDLVDAIVNKDTKGQDKMISDRKLIRCRWSGVFFGEVVERNGQEVIISNARRIWRWKGARTLSELASFGTTSPNDCKFPAPCETDIQVLDAIEVLDVSLKAEESLDSVPVTDWEND